MSLEVAIHRALLNNDVRTFDPWGADFFFVPVYVSFNFSTVNGFPAIGHARALLASAIQLVSTQMPFWNRSHGSDHVFVASHEYGACFYAMSKSREGTGVLEEIDNFTDIWCQIPAPMLGNRQCVDSTLHLAGKMYVPPSHHLRQCVDEMKREKKKKPSPSLGNKTGNLPRFNASSFDRNKGLYGYPLAGMKSRGLSILSIVGIGLGSGFLSLVLSFTAVCIWLRVSEHKMMSVEEGKIIQFMPDY